MDTPEADGGDELDETQRADDKSTDKRLVSGWHGRYYEDFEVGDIYKHPFGRTVTETDNVWLTNVTMNLNPMHFNEAYAAETEFGEASSTTPSSSRTRLPRRHHLRRKRGPEQAGTRVPRPRRHRRNRTPGVQPGR